MLYINTIFDLIRRINEKNDKKANNKKSNKENKTANKKTTEARYLFFLEPTTSANVTI